MKRNRPKLCVRVVFGETFPTIYNLPTCDVQKPGGILGFYSFTVVTK